MLQKREHSLRSLILTRTNEPFRIPAANVLLSIADRYPISF
jgi:hypothetical protein